MRAGFRWGLAVRAALIGLGLLPFASAALGETPLFGAVARAADGWFSFQCDQDRARSFALFGCALPVCARCLGIYAGLGLGAALLRPRLSPPWLRLWVGLAAVVMGLDVATEALAMRPPSALLRFTTGLALAYPVGAALVRVASERRAATRARA